ncbi:DinB family protein [Polaromonas aquatica]|uniref:DinB family protein n=1 Tax=Polaromonas aquatica TaxID=332657 RepID=UPI003D64CC53
MDTSTFVDNYRLLARYNRWFNQHVYDAGEQLTDEERKRDRGAFFGSIHNTLNHVMWGDQAWLKRFAAQGVTFEALPDSLLALPAGALHGTVLFEDWAALRAQRERLDVAIEDFANRMPPDYPLRTMRYANTRGVQREHPAWQALTHFFNHQTHHRGQVTALLMQAGVDPGTTDLIAII